MAAQNQLKNVLNQEFNAYVREFKQLLPKLNECKLKAFRFDSVISSHLLYSWQEDRRSMGQQIDQLHIEYGKSQATQHRHQ